MPVEHRSLIRSTSFALLFSALLLVGIVVAMLYLVYRTQDYVAGAAEARRVRSAAADLLINVQDAESGQRGFILTIEKPFLAPYIESIGELEAHAAALESAISTSRFEEIDPKPLRHTIDQKLAELRQTLALTQAGKRDEALAIVRNESGLRLMNEIRTGLSAIIKQADERIVDQFESQLTLARSLRVLTIVVAISIVAAIFVAGLIIRRYIQEILAARKELEGLNVGLEYRVKERTEDLIQANQEIQRFAYIVTHDLRAPLVNIMGFTAELQNALKTIATYFTLENSQQKDELLPTTMAAVNEDLPEAIGFIRSSTRKMDDLINAILKISRDGRRQLKPERVDLENLVQQSVDAIRHQLQDADGDVETAIEVKGLITDRFSIEQILGNLFDNAVKYRDQKRPLRIRIHAYNINPYSIAINVRDNGRGIAEEDYERIFELFRRSGTQDKPGEGIGLAHVRSLIRNMGGDISLKSNIGEGTEFVIHLPADLSRFVGSSSV